MKKLMEQVMNDVIDRKGEGDLILSSSKALKMSAQNGEINEYKVSSSQILGVRVIRDGKVGISYTESLDDESLKLFVKQAFENAEMSEANSNEGILDLSGHLSDEADYPESEVDVSVKTKKTLELESEVKRLDSRVKVVPHSSYTEGESKSLYLSSAGRSTSYFDKSYTIVGSALMEDLGRKANYYDYSIAHTFDQLNWKKVLETSLFHAGNLLDEKALPTGKYSVRFTEDTLKSIIGCFSNFYSAQSGMEKSNPWIEKLGEEVISKDLSLKDEPLYPAAFRKSLFDSEGVERKSLSLIENGVLKNFYHNSKTARHYKAQSTGHASRGAGSSLGVDGTYMILDGKNKKPLPRKYLEVIQADGLYSGANRITGQFSVAIKGYVWENGVRTMTFGNITLSGNLMELLKTAEVVGEQLVASTDESFFSVPLMFHDVSIAGT